MKTTEPYRNWCLKKIKTIIIAIKPCFMKQKIICIVFLITAVYMQASSKECAKVFKQPAGESISQPKRKVLPVALTEETETVLTASPFSRLLSGM